MSSFIDLDLRKIPSGVDMFLAKPNKSTIAKLKSAYNVNLNMKLGNIFELTFELPLYIDVKHELVKNPVVDMIKEKFLVKLVCGNISDWYVISALTEKGEEGADSIEVHAFLLSYELKDKTLRKFKATSVKLTTALMGGIALDRNGQNPIIIDSALGSSLWSVGYVDAIFDTTFRAFEVSSSTLLEYVFEVANSFNALIVWDTHNRKINFYDPLKYGIDRGLRFSYGKYLSSISKESNADEMVTRLKAYGKDELTFNEVNITGQNYIEDFSFFMFPFERDENRVVIQHSNYMDDDLCHAILDYQQYVNSRSGEFKSLLEQKTLLTAQFDTEDAKLQELQGKLDTIQAQIDIALSTNNDTTTLRQQQATLQQQFNSQKAIVDGIDLQIDAVVASIAQLRNDLKMENHFSSELINELSYYIIEREWSDSNLTHAQDLYDEALKRFAEMKQPAMKIDIEVVNFLELVEAQRDWGKLNLGDYVTIQHERFGIDVQAKIIEVKISFEDGRIDITIANTKDISDDGQKLIKILNNSASTSATVNISKYGWNAIGDLRSTVNNYINGTLDATKQTILAGANESVDISRRGIIVRDSTDPNTYLVMQHGVLAITPDGGNTWNHAITKNGIVGERIYGKLLAGVNLVIDASDAQGTKLFTVDGNGVTISGTKLTITGGLPPSQLDPSFANGLVNLGTAYNGIVIDSANGLVVTRSDMKAKITLAGTSPDGFSGLKIEQNTGTSSNPTWVKSFYVDANGNLVANNLTTNNLIIKDGTGTVTLIDASTKTIDFSKFTVINGKDSALKGVVVKDANGVTTFSVDVNGNVTIAGNASISGNINMTSGSITWGNVAAPSYSQITGTKPPTDANNTYSELLYNSGIRGFVNVNGTLYLSADYIRAGTISANYINGGVLSGVTVNVATNVNVGNMIYLNPSTFSSGIQWGSNNLANITIDQISKAMFIQNNQGGGVYAVGSGGTFRLDQQPVAVFG